LNRRIETKVYEYLDETRLGFVPHKGTQDTIILLKMLTQQALETNRTVYVGFLDYEKPCDRVKHEEIMRAIMVT